MMPGGATLRENVGDDTADFNVLSVANERGKFAVGLTGAGWSDAHQRAFERGLEQDWYRFIDIAFLSAADGRLCKVYLLTSAGRARLDELKRTHVAQVRG
jgi:hypothetical protein